MHQVITIETRATITSHHDNNADILEPYKVNRINNNTDRQAESE